VKSIRHSGLGHCASTPATSCSGGDLRVDEAGEELVQGPSSDSLPRQAALLLLRRSGVHDTFKDKQLLENLYHPDQVPGRWKTPPRNGAR